MKVCKKCLKRKLLSAFYKGKRYKSGRRSNCISCTKNLVNGKRRSLTIKPFCKRIQCKNRIPYGKQSFCSKDCLRLINNERVKIAMRKTYHTEAYRRAHREYMRKYNNIDPEKYRVL